MEVKTKKSLIVILIIVFLFLAIFVSRSFSIYSNKSELEHGKAIINNQTVWLEIARTSAEQIKGLSGRESMAEDEGMLFIFEPKTRPSFWMKGMQFPLDIIWLVDNKIVDLNKNLAVPTGDNLATYEPKNDINYAIEVNAGFADKNNLKIGDKIDLEF